MNTAEKHNEVPEETIDIDAVAGDNNLIKQAMAEDPLVRFFYQNQKLISYIIIAALLGIIGTRYYEKSHAASQERSAELLYGIQSAYSSITDSDDKAKEAFLRKLQGSLVTLKDQQKPYDELSQSYETLALVKSGDVVSAKSKIAAVDWKGDKTEGVVLKELLVLSVAKSLLAVEGEEKFAKNLIKDLAQNSQYVFVSAATTLSDIAETEQDKTEVKAIVENIKTAHPEQINLLDN